MELKLPELGEGVHEGELIAWKVKPGDVVKDDQPVCEIMTDKATVELPAPFSGKVTALSAKVGDVIKVGQVILTYEGGGAAKTATASAAPAASAPAPTKSSHAPAASAPMAAAAAPMATASVGNVLAAPATRRFAREVGVDLGQVSGTGPHGRVMKEDVESSMKGGTGAVAAGSPSIARGPARTYGAGAPDERIAIRGLRKKISEKMRLSKDRAAHFTYVEEADATQLVALRAQAKEMGSKMGVKVTFLPIVMKAMVAALREFPTMNSNIDDEKNELVVKHTFNIGLSIQTDDGLTAPVVKHVEQKSIFELAKEIEDLVNRARAKKLTQDDFSGGSITLTNAGSIGGLFATPIINYPEVAILGFNKIFRKPVVVKNSSGNEEIAIRDWTYFSISLDHRVIDGAVAAEFMKAFIRIIENPALLVLG